MEPLTASSIPNTPAPVTYAGFWKRFAARLIDQLLMGVVAIIFVIPLLMMLGLGIGNISDGDFDMNLFVAFLGIIVLFACFLLVIQWLYYALMESKKGATVGKMALGISVTDMDGNRISFGRATARYFAKIISGLTLGVGFLMAGFTQQKQALHDIIAGCLVINK